MKQQRNFSEGNKTKSAEVDGKLMKLHLARILLCQRYLRSGDFAHSDSYFRPITVCLVKIIIMCMITRAKFLEQLTCGGAL